MKVEFDSIEEMFAFARHVAGLGVAPPSEKPAVSGKPTVQSVSVAGKPNPLSYKSKIELERIARYLGPRQLDVLRILNEQGPMEVATLNDALGPAVKRGFLYAVIARMRGHGWVQIGPSTQYPNQYSLTDLGRAVLGMGANNRPNSSEG